MYIFHELRSKRLPPKKHGEVRIAHLTDLHLYPTRTTVRGRIKHIVSRLGPNTTEAARAVVEDISKNCIDHIVVTGDLTNFASEEEFERFRSILAEFDSSERLSVVPGNHDVSYRRKDTKRPKSTVRAVKLKEFIHQLSHLIPYEAPARRRIVRRRSRPFPYVKEIADGRICLIGIDSTSMVPVNFTPLNALGNVGRRQLSRLKRILSSESMSSKIKIVLMHHHPLVIPFYNWGDSLLSLKRSSTLVKVLYRGEVDLVLHGHKHHPFCWQTHIEDQHNMAVVCGAPPAMLHLSPDAKGLSIHYNVYSFDKRGLSVFYKECPYEGEAMLARLESLTQRFLP